MLNGVAIIYLLLAASHLEPAARRTAKLNDNKIIKEKASLHGIICSQYIVKDEYIKERNYSY